MCSTDTDPKARFPLCLPPLLSRAPVLLGRKSTQARGCLRSGQDQKVENTRAAEKKSDKSTIKTLRDRSLGPAPTASPRAGSRAGTCGGRAVLGTPGRPPHLLHPNPTGLCAREEWVKRTTEQKGGHRGGGLPSSQLSPRPQGTRVSQTRLPSELLLPSPLTPRTLPAALRLSQAPVLLSLLAMPTWVTRWSLVRPSPAAG